MAQPTQTRRVKAIRAFRRKGKVVGVDSVIDVNMTEFSDLITSGKAVKVDPDTKLAENSDIPTPPDGSLPDQESAPESKSKGSK